MSPGLERAAQRAVQDALGIRDGEQVLLVTDESKLDIARELGRACRATGAEVTTYLMTEALRPITRPTRMVETMLRCADVTFYMLDKRIEEKPFRGLIGKLGQRGRVCMMPGITVEMMERLVDVDFAELRGLTERVIDAMRDATAVHVTNPKGTDVRFSVRDRRWIADVGDISQPHTHGCLPAGEAYTCPVERGMTGSVAFCLIDDRVGPGWLAFEDGVLRGHEGSGIERVLRNIGDDPTGRVIGEFGIGTNPRATVCPVMLEAEKAFGTCHFAIGDAFGIGRNSSLHHYDALVEQVTVVADGRCLIEDGRFRILMERFMTTKPQRLVSFGSGSLLARILDQPDLPAQIQSVPPAVLGRLVAHVGLEDAGELVALATTEQLAEMLDEDVWHNQGPGEEERFDPQRFLLWLEILLEAGESFVVKKLLELPEDVVTLALQQHILVLDLAELASSMQASDEVQARLLDKALESCPYEELGDYQVMARAIDGWDTILTVLLAIDRDHHDWLWRVLERCCAMSSEYIEDNGGLYEVLTAAQMLESDVAAEREDRRAARGFVSPATAASFLELARRAPDTPFGEHDVVTRAYFRALDRAPHAKGTTKGKPAAATATATAPRGGGLQRIMQDAGLLQQAQTERLLAPAAGRSKASAEPLLIQAMRLLGEDAPRLFDQRSEELAYLANVLVSGCTFQQRRLRPIEAVAAVIATCSLGLALSLESQSPKEQANEPLRQALDALRRLPADGLFRLAWRRLYEAVADAAAAGAMSVLERASQRAGASDRAALTQTTVELRTARAERAPWRALGKLDGLGGLLEPAVLDVLSGLMDECPTLRGALGADDAPRSGRGGEAAPRFIATPAELDAAEQFIARLTEEAPPKAAGQRARRAPAHRARPPRKG